MNENDLTLLNANNGKKQTVGINRNYNTNPGKTLKVLSSVAAGMNNNPYFPDMVPTIEVLITARGHLQNALYRSKKSRSNMSKSETLKAQKEAINLLNICAAYVLEKSNNNYAMAKTSGFTLTKTQRAKSRPKPEKVVILEVKKHIMPKQIIFKIKALGDGVMYLLEKKIEGTEEWVKCDLFTNSRKIIAENIEPKVQYSFRITAKTSGGYGPPSNIVFWIGQI
jgi:hypothetical protein